MRGFRAFFNPWTISFLLMVPGMVVLMLPRQPPTVTGDVLWTARDFLDSAAASAGLPPMYPARPLATNDWELRVTVSTPFVDQKLIRIRRTNGTTSGQLYYWWRGIDQRVFHGTEEQKREYAAKRVENAKHTREYMIRERGCDRLMGGPSILSCTVSPAETVDWSALLRKLDRLGVSRLRSQSDLNGIDGFSLLVESQRGARYHAYEYWTPQKTDPDADTRSAAKIFELLWGLYR
jgi:hypothetical protein